MELVEQTCFPRTNLFWPEATLPTIRLWPAPSSDKLTSGMSILWLGIYTNIPLDFAEGEIDHQTLPLLAKTLSGTQ